MASYRVNEVYPCVQGEGCLTGTAMVLLRLQGCEVLCPWCDTVDAQALDGGTEMAEGEIVAEVKQYPGPRWIMVTGGEPARYQLRPLVAALHAERYMVALETSGTETGHIGVPFDWVCVSPKIGMPGGKIVKDEALLWASEIKWPVGRERDIEALDEFLRTRPVPKQATICLQPISCSKDATALCYETVLAKGFRLSIQVHKLLGVA